MHGFVNELALLFLLATALSILARLFKQPLMLAYLLTGGIVAYFGFIDLIGQETFQVFSDLGIMFLLFLVGLEINYTSLRLVGRTSIIIGTGQIVITSILGFFLSTLLGFSTINAIYIAVALTFSSTIIVVKLLSDKKDLNSLYGKITIGFLLVQDLVAIFILIILSSLEAGESVSWFSVLFTFFKGVGLLALMMWLGRKVMPYLFDAIAHSQELLFLASTAWVILLAALVSKIGFSIEIAGFLAGLALANSSETLQIAQRIKPLRDFFILVFFIILGSSFVTANFAGLGLPILIFSLFVLIGNPLIILALMGIMGFKRRTSFLTGLAVAQISEFSLILVASGLKIGHIDASVVGVVTAVGIITITASSYLITHSSTIYRLLSEILWIFERKRTSEPELAKDSKKTIVLIGFHRTGQSLARHLPKKDLLVIDFDPEISAILKRQKYEHLFGDLSDPEMLDKIALPHIKLVISTSADMEDNLTLLKRIKTMKKRPKIILRADTETDALAFYNSGADYVLVPHFVSGHHLGKTLAADPHLTILPKLKAKDMKFLGKF